MTNFTRRQFLKTTAYGAAVLATPAIIRPARAQSGNVIRVWTYANFIPQDYIMNFQNETDIEVQMRLMDDQGKLFNLLVAEGDSSTVDIVTVANSRFLQFIASGLLSPVDEGRLTNWNRISPIYSDGDWIRIQDNKWGVPILSGAQVLAFNTELVPREEANTWDAMFDPKYRGQTAYIIQDMMSVMMLYRGYDGNMIEYMDDPERAAEVVRDTRDFMIENKDMVRKFYEGGAEIQQMFVNQEIALAHSWHGPIARLIMDGFPIEATIPQEGSYGNVYSLSLTARAQNTDNAYRFLNGLIESAEMGAQMTRSSGFISTMQGYQDHLNALELRASGFSEEELGRLVLYRAEADEMKYRLLDPAVQAIQAA